MDSNEQGISYLNPFSLQTGVQMAVGWCRGIQSGITGETSTEVKPVITTHIYIYC